MDYALIVIGSGPGGYHAAIRGAQLGLKVACIEKAEVGGVCLNVGCIPTKALLHVAHTLEEAKHADAYGVEFGTPELDLKRLMDWQAKVVTKHTAGVAQLLKGNKVDLIRGEARFVEANAIRVEDRRVTGERFIVATGSRPIVLPGLEPDGQRVVDSTGALRVTDVPRRFLTLGGSAIGLEFADIYASLGSEVTVVEMMDQIVPTADVDIAKALHKALTQRGMTIRTGTRALSQEETEGATEVVVEGQDGTREKLVVDRVLVAVGRSPNGRNLGLEDIGVHVDERGFVPTSETMQTSVPHVYAIGDVTRGPLLAHKAMKEGLVAAEHAAGKKVAYDTLVPSVIYTSPELASVGMTEAEAAEAGFETLVGSFPLSASGRATTMGATTGVMKVVADARTDQVLGVHLVCPGAGELIAEATLAMEMGATVEDIGAIQHAHPTLSEGLMEAAEHAHGRAIHIANRRR
jgi:dihydrolipoamide dehydrogenase